MKEKLYGYPCAKDSKRNGREIKLSKHAVVRQQQRGIPPLIIDWLLEHGSIVHQHDQSKLHHFDRTARRRLERRCGRAIIKRLDEFLDAYAIVKDDVVVTTGSRYKSVRH